MPLFAMTCLDKPNALQVRMAARPDHLEFIKGLGDAVKLAGPFLDGDEQMCGSLIVVEAADLAAAQAINAADPYTRAGLWRSVEVRAFRASIGKL